MTHPLFDAPSAVAGRYRSTSLNLASEHCPAALSFWEAETPYDRTGFEVGLAAHAVLQAAGEATNAAGRELEPQELEAVGDATVRALIEVGRTFDGRPEPPLGADRARDGRDLALAWLARHPLAPGARYEVGLAADYHWRPVPYDHPQARVVAIVDVEEVIEDGDEEGSWKTLRVTDYKSSWAADEGELDTLQRRLQAVLAVLHHPDVDVLRLEVANLRMGKVFAEPDLTLDEDGRAQLARWRADATAEMLSRDAQAAAGPRPAIPGAGCHGCPYLGACAPARAWYEAQGIPDTPEARARAYAVVQARLKQLADVVKAETVSAPIDLGDGHVVGTVGKSQRVLAAGGYRELWDAWKAGREFHEGLVLGILHALDIGVGAAEKVLKVLYPAKAEKIMREDVLDQIVELETVRRFGVWPKEGAE